MPCSKKHTEQGIYALFRAQVILGLLRNDTTMTLFLIRLRRRQVQILTDFGRGPPVLTSQSQQTASPVGGGSSDKLNDILTLHTGWRRADSVRTVVICRDCGL